MRVSIRTRLTVTFIALAVIPLLVVGGIVGLKIYQVQRQQALDFESQVVKRVATKVEGFVQGLEKDLWIVTKYGFDDLSAEQQQEALSVLLSFEGLFDELTLLDVQGHEQMRISRSRIYTSEDLGNRSDLAEFKSPSSSRQTYYSSVRFDSVNNEPLMTLALPLFDLRSGEFTGVLVADARLRKVWNLIAEIPVSAGEKIYVVDEQNVVIAHREPSVVLRGTSFAPPEQDGMHTGLDGNSVALATEKLEFGDQTFIVVAEKAESQALAVATQVWQLIIGVIVVSLLIASILGFMAVRLLVRPIAELSMAAEAVRAGDLSKQVRVTTRDELGDLAAAFNSMTEQLRQTLQGLEQRVAERTVDLERRSLQLEAAAQVARGAAAIREVDQLLDATVRFISERFGFYHAGIFLLDEVGEYAILQAVSSEGGQRMLARGHKLKVGQVGIVGYAAGQGKYRISLDVGADAAFFDNPDLPQTRSEMALPLKVRDKVIGVLDVQSTEAAAFSDEDVALFQTMADQVALAIDNARLLEESQRALYELETLYGRQTRDTWRKRVAQRQVAYRYTGVGVEPVLSGQASAALDSESKGEQPHQIETPIRLRGQTIGSIALKQDAEQPPWSLADQALVQEISAQVALALENARLLEETRRRAERERLIGAITARIRESLDLEDVLQTAVREIGGKLGLAQAQVRLGSGPGLVAPQATDRSGDNGSTKMDADPIIDETDQ